MNINIDIDNTVDKRKKYYPFILDQLDALRHDIEDGKLGADAKTGKWYLACKAVKDKYPK